MAKRLATLQIGTLLGVYDTPDHGRDLAATRAFLDCARTAIVGASINIADADGRKPAQPRKKARRAKVSRHAKILPFRGK